jgi:hypothetical protein
MKRGQSGKEDSKIGMFPTVRDACISIPIIYSICSF